MFPKNIQSTFKADETLYKNRGGFSRLSFVSVILLYNHFQYVGAMITEDGKCEADVRYRLGMARSLLSELEHLIWKSRAIT